MAQALALGERVSDQAKLALRQVAQAAVNQLGGTRRGCAGEVATLDERDSQSAHRRVTRDRRAVYPAADDREVEAVTGKTRNLFVAA